MSIPDYDYIAYIDEAGDPGLNRVRPIDEVGGTEWFVIGCALIRKSDEDKPPAWIKNILSDLGIHQRPDLHYRDLSPTRKLRACKLAAQLPIRYFAIASNKKNMRKYQNERAEKKSYSKQWFYNWCCRLAMERITDFVLRDSIKRHKEPRLVHIEFSKRQGHSYTQTQGYHALLKTQSRANNTLLKKRVPKWQVMDQRLVSAKSPYESAGTQLADCVTSSIYDAVDKLDTGPCNIEPAKLLKSRMAFEHDACGGELIKDYGISLHPTPDFSANIDEDQKEIFRFYGYDFIKKW